MNELSLRPYNGRLIVVRSQKEYERAHMKLFKTPDVLTCAQGGRFSGGEGIDGVWTYLVWDKRAEALAKYLLKGTLIGVVGEVSLDEFRAKDGSKRAQIAVKVQDITLLGAKTDSPSPPSEGPGIDEGENIPVENIPPERDFPF